MGLTEEDVKHMLPADVPLFGRRIIKVAPSVPRDKLNVPGKNKTTDTRQDLAMQFTALMSFKFEQVRERTFRKVRKDSCSSPLSTSVSGPDSGSSSSVSA